MLGRSRQEKKSSRNELLVSQHRLLRLEEMRHGCGSPHRFTPLNVGLYPETKEFFQSKLPKCYTFK